MDNKKKTEDNYQLLDVFKKRLEKTEKKEDKKQFVRRNKKNSK